MRLSLGGRVAAEERGTSWPVLGSTVCVCVLCFLGGRGDSHIIYVVVLCNT